MSRRLDAKLNKKDFLAELAAFAESLRRQIEAGCSAFPVDPGACRERRARVHNDFPFFRRLYFPHYVTEGAGDSVLHTALDAALPEMIDAPEGGHLAVAAPRGEAKSTFVGLFFLLWCVVTGRRHYLLLIADTKEQAAALLEAAKAELEANPRLQNDFAEHCGQGRVWNVWTALTPSNVKLQALGAGKKMRGLRHGPRRPDLVILDDLENDENVVSPEQRDKLQSWLQKTVLNLGPPDGSLDIIYVGTILHYDSVLARTLNKPGWRALRFRALIEWPRDMTLWDQWEAVYAAEGPQAALKLYMARKADMDAGAVVSWPGMRNLYRLMLLRAEDHNAFDSEQQNDPLAGDAAPFANCIHFWIERDPKWLFFGSIDPSMGKQGAGRDPSALLIGGYNRETMTLDVVEALIKKRHPDGIIQDAIALHRQYNCLIWAVEAVQFQEFFADVLMQKGLMQGVALPVRAIKVHTDKQLRIETLQPYMAAARIRVHHTQKTLIDQLRHFPMADHDDGPDALHQLWEIAVKGFYTISEDSIMTVAPTGDWRPARWN
ncbi:MAG: phage terminase large subunit [Desulfovibrio sp.]|jgi:predicted phage terminase large subunit-like protein|nr:phage terminase large subunit [Desulfovibrio sp.]